MIYDCQEAVYLYAPGVFVISLHLMIHTLPIFAGPPVSIQCHVHIAYNIVWIVQPHYSIRVLYLYVYVLYVYKYIYFYHY